MSVATEAPRKSAWKSVKVDSLKIAHPETSVTGRKIGVDRQKEIIHGYIVAQEGPFKSEGRGEFDQPALAEIVRLMSAAPNGTKSRYSHPDLSGDGIGSFLGRAKNPWIDTITLRDSQGELRTDPIQCVRADLHLDPSAHKSPRGDLAEYVMALVESDPDAVSSSMVLQADEEYRIEPDGRAKCDAEGNELPPLWRPLKIHASDFVCTGDAVDGVLSQQLDAEGLPDGVVRKAAELMDRQFAGKPREFVQARCAAWLGRYLDRRYGVDDEAPELAGEAPPTGEDAPIVDDPCHDGCRSRHGLHYIKQCSCGTVIEKCGCKHVAGESRVIRVVKDACEACRGGAGPAADPPAELDPDEEPPVPAEEMQSVDQTRRLREFDLLTTEP